MRKLVLLLFCVCFPLSISFAAGEQFPKAPFEHWGACPFECCTYRDWTAEEEIPVYKERDTSNEPIFFVKKGAVVKAMTGVVVTKKFGVTEIVKSGPFGYHPNSDKKVLRLRAGEKLYTLHYAGEGMEYFWYRGKIYLDEISVPENAWGEVPGADEVKVLSRPKYEWWAKLRDKKGRIGWTPHTDHFTNQDACG
jgi:hypothetical protein